MLQLGPYFVILITGSFIILWLRIGCSQCFEVSAKLFALWASKTHLIFWLKHSTVSYKALLIQSTLSGWARSYPIHSEKLQALSNYLSPFFYIAWMFAIHIQFSAEFTPFWLLSIPLTRLDYKGSMVLHTHTWPYHSVHWTVWWTLYLLLRSPSYRHPNESIL